MNMANPLGVGLMLAAVFIVCFAGKIVRHYKGADAQTTISFVKLCGLLLCMAGALIATLC